MKKGRHRRYEEARKFQRATAEQFAVEDYDFEDSDRFGVAVEDDDAAPDDQYGHLADKYDDYLDGQDDEAVEDAGLPAGADDDPVACR